MRGLASGQKRGSAASSWRLAILEQRLAHYGEVSRAAG